MTANHYNKNKGVCCVLNCLFICLFIFHCGRFETDYKDRTVYVCPSDSFTDVPAGWGSAIFPIFSNDTLLVG